jgi:hypothetical protein
MAVVELRPHCQGTMSIEQRIEKAFRSAQRFWASGDDNVRYKGAVLAAYLEAGDSRDLEGQQRIERASRALAAISAAVAGTPVDLSNLDPDPHPLPLLKMWMEAKNGSKN